MEFNHLKQALQKNKHDKKNINKIISKLTNKAMNPNVQLSQDEMDKKIFFYSPTYKRNSESYWQDTEQIQHPNRFQTSPKNRANFEKS